MRGWFQKFLLVRSIMGGVLGGEREIVVTAAFRPRIAGSNRLVDRGIHILYRSVCSTLPLIRAR